MPKRSLAPLGETELEVLQHVWDLGRATVADVHKRVLAERELAYTTVMSVMRKLADKGYLTYEQEGAAYVYRPAKSAQQVRASILGDILAKAFRGSPVSLVHTLVKRGGLSRRERAEILALIQKMDDAGGLDDEEEGA